jgi:tetrapyrrole methylase family protein/MazG family protein
MIKIVGLGPGELKDLPLGVYNTLKESNKIILRTKDHPVVRELEGEGVVFESFDSVYEMFDGFDEVYEEIVKQLIQIKDCVYAVPGHPMLAEKTVQLLVEQNDVEINVIGGQSFLDVLFQALKIDPIEGFMMVDSHQLKPEYINRNLHIIIPQIYSQWIASEVKLDLMEVMDDEDEVFLLKELGTMNEEVKKIKLYELDRSFEVNNLTTLYIPKKGDLNNENR